MQSTGQCLYGFGLSYICLASCLITGRPARSAAVPVLFLPVCSLYRWVQWSNWQSIGLVTEKLWVRLTPGPLQATLSKLLTYCVLRPTQPPTLSGTGNEQQLRLRGEGLVWLIRAMVCLLAAPQVQLSISAGNGWRHNALRHHWLMPISCHFRDCKALLVTSLTHVSGAISSVQTFTFIFTFIDFRTQVSAVPLERDLARLQYLCNKKQKNAEFRPKNVISRKQQKICIYNVSPKTSLTHPVF